MVEKGYLDNKLPIPTGKVVWRCINLTQASNQDEPSPEFTEELDFNARCFALRFSKLARSDFFSRSSRADFLPFLSSAPGVFLWFLASSGMAISHRMSVAKIPVL